ncbi:FAD/NAD(P)-binding domain-containing protein [Moniliophthora roreri MCA 2997]|uniref:FAD/NAD(P)-binding domain-containing protein n=1 Tax=Moniliophthora roreri (strain MCA 2997) TaxID=1381753 RepID=V2WYE8_MONRO|nr:FAD/NAD(P)-binding domain-containing protein [Moniliophthora roreri MCA 2997]
MPGHVMNVRKAQVSLEIVVIGGSIAGLAAAYSLQRGGHRVVVLEQTDGRERSRGGLRSPPNMTRVLNHWGLQPYLAKHAVKCSQLTFLYGETGKDIGCITLHEEQFADLLADFRLMQHGDLHSILLDIALREGVEIRYNMQVAGLDSLSGAVVLANGERIIPNLVVGADGQRGLTRKCLLPKEVQEDEFSSDQITLLFTIPTDRMRDDEDLKHLIKTTEIKIWLGDSYLCQGHLSHASKEYSLLLSYSIDDDLSEYRENWTKRYSVDHFDLDYDRFEPSVRKLLQLAEYTIPTSYANRPLFDSLVCDNGHLVLVGEAAHPLVPGGVQPTAMCLEDAEILGSLLSRIQAKEDLPRLLSAYEELRLPRCREADRYENRNRLMFTLPKGPEQKLRDAKLRWGTAGWDKMSEQSFWDIWGEELKFYPFDASEKADDWWTKWGALVSRQNSRNGANFFTPPTPTVEVSISNH